MPDRGQDDNGRNSSDRYFWEQLVALREEMARTREAMRRYNDLRETQNNLLERVARLEKYKHGRESARQGNVDLQDRWIKWGGWIIAMISLFVAAGTLFVRMTG